ncbi:recombinase family protein [Anaerosporobacter sp.]
MIYVAAYCRVSTDREDQVNSFESQQRYFREYISRTEGLELYEIYADEGLSGTSTKKRKAFNRMIEEAREGRFQMIVTKEISRFARNTLDSIYYTRELKKYGVGVFFLNDNINTLDSDAELRLTILSSIAQEESRRTSERVKWGQKRRMEQGIVFGSSMLGYDVKNGKIYWNEEGAKVVRRIYDKFLLEGKGTYVIAKELREEGNLPLRAKEWSSSVILRILRNEKYCGDLIQKKTYTPDYLTHEKRYNYGEEDYVVIHNHHVPIISREEFNQVQTLLDHRARKIASKEKESNRYALSGKIMCGGCKRCYIARARLRKDGSVYLVWRCFHGEEKNNNEVRDIEPSYHEGINKKLCKECINSCIKNEELMRLIKNITLQLPIDKEEFIKHMMGLIKRCLARKESSNEFLDKIIDLEEERKRLLIAYRKNYITEEEFITAREECNQEARRYAQMMGRDYWEDASDGRVDRDISGDKSIEYNLGEREQAIRKLLEELIYGVRLDDTICRELVDHIVRVDLHRYEIYYKVLPGVWKAYL